MRRVPGRVMVTVALLLVGAPGCGGDSPPSSAAVSSSAASSTRTHGATPNLDASLGIGASVAQYRRDEAVGVVQLKAVAGPDTPPSLVTSAQLR